MSQPTPNADPKAGWAPSPRREPISDTAVERISRWGRESPFFASLQIRLAMLVLVAVVPILGLVLYSAFERRAETEAVVRQEALLMVRLAADRQDELLETTRQLLATMARLPEVQSRDKEACERTFQHLLSLHPLYANLGAIRPDGVAFASGVPLTNDVYLGDRLYFQAATNTRSFALGEYQIGRITRKATFNVGYPVIDPGGELRAVLYAALDLAWLKSMLTNSTLPAGSSLTVVDRHGVTLVRHPDPEEKYLGDVLPLPSRFRTKRPPSQTNATASPSSGSTSNAPPRPQFSRVRRGPHTNEVTFVTRGRDGVERLYALTALGRRAGPSPGGVMVGIPVEATSASANRSLRRNLLIVAAVTVVALGLAWFGGNIFILRRVRALVRATDRISAGDYGVRLGRPYGTGELHILSRAFDEMAETLGKRTAERERAQAGLRALNEQLEQRVGRRTAQLQRSNEDLEQFAYVASHDLQEPLRMVARYVALLRDRYQAHADPKTREFIDFALDGAARMQELIQALLAYSRLDTQGQPFAPTDCNQVLDRALLNLKVALEENRAVVTRTPLPKVMADRVQLGQLFQNLVGNALKFRGEQTPEIAVAAVREGEQWQFSVQDNGIGIDPEHFQQIFVLFQRLHSRAQYPGTGIGLALCKKIVERHGGRIWVESQPGRGSTFRFTLPAKLEPPTAEVPPAAGDTPGLFETRNVS